MFGETRSSVCRVLSHRRFTNHFVRGLWLSAVGICRDFDQNEKSCARFEVQNLLSLPMKSLALDTHSGEAFGSKTFTLSYTLVRSIQTSSQNNDLFYGDSTVPASNAVLYDKIPSQLALS